MKETLQIRTYFRVVAAFQGSSTTQWFSYRLFFFPMETDLNSGEQTFFTTRLVGCHTFCV